MTEQDTMKVLAILRAGLPNAFLKLSDTDAKAMAALWAEMFRNYPAGLVMAAAKTYIWRDTSGRFPSPGAIRELMDGISDIINRCSYGYTIREYYHSAADRYPAAVQDYINHTAAESYRNQNGNLPPTEAERMARALQEARAMTDGSDAM